MIHFLRFIFVNFRIRITWILIFDFYCFTYNELYNHLYKYIKKNIFNNIIFTKYCINMLNKMHLVTITKLLIERIEIPA